MTLKGLLLGAVASVAFAPAVMAERGADGQLNIIMWQAPSTMNMYLSSGTKDIIAASMTLEALAGFKTDGTLFPKLAQEIPSVENGGISEDLKSVTWKLKEGLKWSDGTPVTSADVAFTAQYCMDPEGGCAQLAKFEGVKDVEVIDDLTVKVNFTEPRPDPFSAFVGGQAPIIQKAQFEKCLGAAAPTCTTENFNPSAPARSKSCRSRPMTSSNSRPIPNIVTRQNPHSQP